MKKYLSEWMEIMHVCNAINGEIIFNGAFTFMLMLRLFSSLDINRIMYALDESSFNLEELTGLLFNEKQELY